MNYKKYNNIKLYLSITKTIVTFFLILGFIAFGYSNALSQLIYQQTDSNYLALLYYVIVVGFAMSILFFPINFYAEYLLEHRFNLSNQTILTWAWEKLKATLIGSIIGIPLLLLFYYILLSYGNLWWLPFSILLFFYYSDK